MCDMLPADLREIRESLGLNQTKMAKKLKISRPRYAMYERGSRKIPPHIALLVRMVAKGASD